MSTSTTTASSMPSACDSNVITTAVPSNWPPDDALCAIDNPSVAPALRKCCGDSGVQFTDQCQFCIINNQSESSLGFAPNWTDHIGLQVSLINCVTDWHHSHNASPNGFATYCRTPTPSSPPQGTAAESTVPLLTLCVGLLLLLPRWILA